MDESKAELEGVSLVFLGRFHPGMVHPAWLAARGLIRESEAADAELVIASNEITQFALDWVRVLVSSDRLQLEAVLSAYFPAVGDLAVGLLRVLPAIQVSAVGINHEAHFKLTNEGQWHALGHALAPKDFWGKVSKNPGTHTIAVQGQREDDRAGRIVLTVEPSAKVEHGVYLKSNDHYELAVDDERSADVAASLIDAALHASQQRSGRYFREMLAFAATLGGAHEA